MAFFSFLFLKALDFCIVKSLITKKKRELINYSNIPMKYTVKSISSLSVLSMIIISSFTDWYFLDGCCNNYIEINKVAFKNINPGDIISASLHWCLG